MDCNYKEMISDENINPDESIVEVCLDCGVVIKIIRMNKDELEMFRQADEVING